jgi:hypothetical protein
MRLDATKPPSDARRRYVPAGYPSLLACCVECLHLSNDAALKRIQAARVARRFPVVFPALAVGRLHLSRVVLLAPCPTHGNAGELLRAAFHRTKGQCVGPQPPARSGTRPSGQAAACA